MKYFKKLEGENIYLSPMCAEDAETYTKWINDFKVTDGLGQSDRLNTIEGEKKWLNSALEGGEHHFAIITQDGDKLIGNCGFNDLDAQARTAEVGIFIGESDTRGKGYGTEALNLLLDFGFNYLNLHSARLKVFDFNEGAIKCYKKVGFKEVGKLRDARFINGKYYGSIYMDILESEFAGSYIKNKNI